MHLSSSLHKDSPLIQRLSWGVCSLNFKTKKPQQNQRKLFPILFRRRAEKQCNEEKVASQTGARITAVYYSGIDTYCSHFSLWNVIFLLNLEPCAFVRVFEGKAVGEKSLKRQIETRLNPVHFPDHFFSDVAPRSKQRYYTKHTVSCSCHLHIYSRSLIVKQATPFLLCTLYTVQDPGISCVTPVISNKNLLFT